MILNAVQAFVVWPASSRAKNNHWLLLWSVVCFIAFATYSVSAQDSDGPPSPVADPTSNLLPPEAANELAGEQPMEASVQGFVYGQNDEGETVTAIEAAEVLLMDANGGLAASTTTDSDGFYSIEGLKPGKFRVRLSAAEYADEDANRGFELSKAGGYLVDFFLAQTTDPSPRVGQLDVQVWSEGKDGRVGISGAKVEALLASTRELIPVPRSGDGVYQTQVPPGEWTVTCLIPGMEDPVMEYVSIAAGGSGNCEIVLEEFVDEVVAPTKVLAIVAVERKDNASGAVPVVTFGAPAPGSAISKRGPPQASDVLDNPLQSAPLRKLTADQLVRLGRDPATMPFDQWDWFLAIPQKPLVKGAYQAIAEFDGYASDTSVSKSLRDDEPTIFDLVLRKPNRDLPVGTGLDDPSTLQGFVYGQNSEGETIETIAGAEIVLRDEKYDAIATIYSDEDGFYHCDDVAIGKLTYRLSAEGYKLENAGRGFSIRNSGNHVVDFFMAAEVGDDEEPTGLQRGTLDGYVTEVNNGSQRPLGGQQDGAIVRLINFRSGRTAYAQPDSEGFYSIQLETGLWSAHASKAIGQERTEAVEVDVVGGEMQHRDFSFFSEPTQGRIAGIFWEESDSGQLTQLASAEASLLITRYGDKQEISVAVPKGVFQQRLASGRWELTPILPSGYELADSLDNATVNNTAVTMVANENVRRDFVIQRVGMGTWACNVWEQTKQEKIPFSAEIVVHRPESDAIETVTIAGSYQSTIRPGKLVSALIVPDGFELVGSAPQQEVMIENGKMATCEFVLKRIPTRSQPTYALVGVETPENLSGQQAINASDLSVAFIRGQASLAGEVFTGSGSEGDTAVASNVRTLPPDEFASWGITDDTRAGFAWFLAEASLPAGQYFAEVNCDGFAPGRSETRTVTSATSTVFDVLLTKIRPRVLVMVVDKDDRPLADIKVNIVRQGKTLSQAIRLVTDASGQDQTMLDDGTGDYKVLLAPPGYDSFGRRVLLQDDENVLKFRLFKAGEQKTIDLNGLVLGEAEADSEPTSTPELISQAKIVFQPDGDAVVSESIQKDYFSGAQGDFRIEQLPEGPYVATISADGYRTLTTGVNVVPGGKDIQFVLSRRNRDFDNAISCMLTKGWGRSPEAMAAARKYYEIARQADPEHGAADYAMALCLLSARRDDDARSQVVRAIRLRGEDFVWDRATEARLWLNMFSGDFETSVREMEAMTSSGYAQRNPNPALNDMVHLMGVSLAALQGPYSDKTNQWDFSAIEQRITSGLDPSLKSLFDEGKLAVAQRMNRFENERTEAEKICDEAAQQRIASEIDRIESRIQRTKSEASSSQARLEGLTVEDIDLQLVELEKQQSRLQEDYDQLDASYMQVQRQYNVAVTQLRLCQSTITRSYREFSSERSGGGMGGNGGGFEEGGYEGGGYEGGGEGNYQGGGGGFGGGGMFRFAPQGYGQYEGGSNSPNETGGSTRTRVRVRTTVTNQCAGLQTQVATLQSQLNVIQTSGNRIKFNQQQISNQHGSLVRQKARIVKFESKLKSSITESNLKIDQANETLNRLESGSSSMQDCEEVRRVEAEMREFFRYKIYPLELRRQELRNWLVSGEGESCP